jgi:hypothetical protein
MFRQIRRVAAAHLFPSIFSSLHCQTTSYFITLLAMTPCSSPKKICASLIVYIKPEDDFDGIMQSQVLTPGRVRLDKLVSSRKGTPTTPTKTAKDLPSLSLSSTPSPSKKRKHKGDDVSFPLTPGKKKKQRWTEGEDKVIKEAIVKIVDKNMDWKAIVALINEGRDTEDYRTAEGVRWHWIQTMKVKFLKET